MFGARYFGNRYFGGRYWGHVGAEQQNGSYFGARHFGVRYFGIRYWGGRVAVPPPSAGPRIVRLRQLVWLLQRRYAASTVTLPFRATAVGIVGGPDHELEGAALAVAIAMTLDDDWGG